MTRPRTSHLLPILPLALGLGACVDSNADSGLTILRAAAADDGCTFSTESDIFLSSGFVQANSRAGYLLAPVVRNDIALREGEVALTPKTVFLTSSTVTIKFYDEDLFSAAEQQTMTTDGHIRFLAPISGSIPPNFGEAVFPLRAVSGDLLAMVNERLIERQLGSTVLDVQIQVNGTRGGSALESNVFRYPVEVCLECVIEILGNCDAIPMGTSIDTGGACNSLQDGQLDCCYGADPDDFEVDCENGEEPPAAAGPARHRVITAPAAGASRRRGRSPEVLPCSPKPSRRSWTTSMAAWAPSSWGSTGSPSTPTRGTPTASTS